MPNGGVPLNMRIGLADGLALIARGHMVYIYQGEEMIGELGEEESRALASFLRYWWSPKMGHTENHDGPVDEQTANPLSGLRLSNVLYDY